MLQRVPDLGTRIAEWRERVGVLPRRNGLVIARQAADVARAEADQAEAAYQSEMKRIIGRGDILNDAAASRAEAAAIAKKVALKKAIADVEVAKAAAAPALDKHLQRHGAAEGLALLNEALQQVLTISKALADVTDAAATDGASPPWKLSRVRRVHVAVKHAWAQIKL